MQAAAVCPALSLHALGVNLINSVVMALGFNLVMVVVLGGVGLLVKKYRAYKEQHPTLHVQE